jgi:hypothetical protein
MTGDEVEHGVVGGRTAGTVVAAVGGAAFMRPRTTF